MSKRKAVPALEVGCLQDADKVLEELAELERRANSIKNELNESIDTAKAKAADSMVPVTARVKQLEAALGAFAVMNKAEMFKNGKSLELDFGVLSFRKSTQVVPANRNVNFEKILKKLKELARTDGIRVTAKEEVNKDALKTWTKEELETIGAKLKTEDTFGYTLKQQEPGLTPAA